jgi:hypothetical protein
VKEGRSASDFSSAARLRCLTHGGRDFKISTRASPLRIDFFFQSEGGRERRPRLLINLSALRSEPCHACRPVCSHLGRACCLLHPIGQFLFSTAVFGFFLVFTPASQFAPPRISCALCWISR